MFEKLKYSLNVSEQEFLKISLCI